MPDERVLFAVVVRAVLVSAGTVNLWLALRDYVRHNDARGLRGFVAGVGLWAGALALLGSSQAISEEYTAIAGQLRILAIIGVVVFVICLLFSCATWLVGRRR